MTTSQVLGTAATLDGKYVGGLDQTGLSQKAGPVVSDLRITKEPVEGTNKVTAGSADVYLVFDLLVGLAPQNLLGVSADRTVAVVSTSKTPTGEMVRDVHAEFPDLGPLRSQLDEATRSEHNRYFDAIAVTEGLFGESTTANTLLLGVAYQLGVIPISRGAIEQAIELNGAAVEANKSAFHWGRQWIVDAEVVVAASVTVKDHLAKLSSSLVQAIDAKGIGEGELGRLVNLRAADLAVYQNEKYAHRYLETVATAAHTGRNEFAEATARYAYKLMAYKDEYEVARLLLEEAGKLTVSNAVGDNVKVKWNLHPPVLRSMGRKNKLVLGSWFTPAMLALRAGKRLRGTAVDPFGRAEVRKVERKLAAEYHVLIAELAAVVNDENEELVAKAAALPDGVRGYEDIKLGNVEHYHSELARMRSQLGI